MNADFAPFTPTRDQLIGFISDTYKEINGFRPRPVWSELTYAQLNQWGRDLSAEVITYRKQSAIRERIERKLAASALGRVLSSQRWSNPDSFERLVDILCKLQNLAQWAGDRLEACDINPLIIGDAGVIAVDALVVPKTNTAGAAEDSALSARS